MKDKNIQEVFNRYQQGTASDDDLALLESWYAQHQNNDPYHIADVERTNSVDRVWLKIQQDIKKPKMSRLWVRISVAASLLVGFSICLLLYFRSNNFISDNQAMVKRISPGTNRAILTLANGKQVILANNQKQQIPAQANTQIQSSASGHLIYTVSGSEHINDSLNTMTTPRGGQYHLTLSDGTNIWLNAASSITYPVNFKGKERIVQVVGEAYFEVAHNPSMPFLVSTHGQTITVLGTHFDVNAYADEPTVHTVLLEGKVQVSTGKSVVNILPGQQSVLSGSNLKVSDADTEDAIAWKNGMFSFTGENLESVMRKVSRWYAVDIEFENPEVKNIPLTGVISHFSDVSDVLHMLEMTKQVKFRVVNRKIIVSDKK
ncbi:FecR family protein [Mucilaginibacter pocheonensis]|uniref:Ferric-dicitrate binding protein FerR (Iron transport regulator) n=1 Tax=Mucilaginibacter pocheonensis TaxID=398050 RepID=A0ABU1TEI1_9SPHI|nr:FecR domain-containing protein [Mucilaginibacter pocheonensis]MDR6943757.1 ferric-dicitrate binding protein FerR (iron transport regulator) [Mucilaginibacter pocheonensis]